MSLPVLKFVCFCHYMDGFHLISHTNLLFVAVGKYVARPQSKFPTRPTASRPYIARSDCTYVIEQ
jgi:hypothetical protein